MNRCSLSVRRGFNPAQDSINRFQVCGVLMLGCFTLRELVSPTTRESRPAKLLDWQGLSPMSTSTRRAPWNSGLFLESQTSWHLAGAHLCLTALSRRTTPVCRAPGRCRVCRGCPKSAVIPSRLQRRLPHDALPTVDAPALLPPIPWRRWRPKESLAPAAPG
jgi:hypothetical protein